jgi:hypothetical protein
VRPWRVLRRLAKLQALTKSARWAGPQLGVGFVVEALDGRVLEGAVHALDLAVGPGMRGLGEAMIDIVASASHLKGGSPEEFAPREMALMSATRRPA